MANTVINTPELLNLDSTTGATVLAKGTVSQRPPRLLNVDYLVVAGGGGGGGTASDAPGGGGAGGLITSYGNSSGGGTSPGSAFLLSISANYTVTVGQGGNGGAGKNHGVDGENSVFHTITSTGGGGGGTSEGTVAEDTGRTGGSAGGSGTGTGSSTRPSTAAVNNPVQGYAGGASNTSSGKRGGGGGGAGETGNTDGQGHGGDGLEVNIIGGTGNYYAGGGGGGYFGSSVLVPGGEGGGGDSPASVSNAGDDGSPNTGGGGGAAKRGAGGGNQNGGRGGDGVVILRYPNNYTINVGAGLTSSTTPDGLDKVTTFTQGTGTITFSGTTVTNQNNAIDGALRFNTETNKTEYFDGTNWYEIVDEYANAYDGIPTNYFETKLYTGNNGLQSIGGYIKGAGGFNGSDAYVDLPLTSLFGGKNTLTVSFWFKTISTSRSRMFTDYAQNSRNIDIIIDSGNIQVVTEYSSNSITFTSSSTYNDGNWHNIVVALDQPSSTRTIYIDKNLEDTDTFSGAYNGTSGFRVTLGGFYSSSSGYNQNQYFNGQIDQLRIYNAALDQQNVTALNGETAATATTAAFPSGQTAVATYTMDTSANGLLNTQDLSTVNYPAGAGCMALYEMNGNSNDTSGTYNGTPTNITYGGGAFDEAAVFGSSSNILLPSNLISGTTDGDYSVSLWVKFDTLPSANFVPLIGQLSNTSAFRLLLYYNSGSTYNVALLRTFGGTYYYNSSNTGIQGTFNVGQYYNVIVTYQSSNKLVNGYLNGNSIGSYTLNASGSGAAGAPALGTYNGTTSYSFDGSIDQVRIFNTVLTQSHATTLARGIATSYSGAAVNVVFNGYLDFQPDLVWAKSRNDTYYNLLMDSVRGTDSITSNNNTQERTNYNRFKSYDTNGFTLEFNNAGDLYKINRGSTDYVSWNWKAGGAAVPNYNGNIISQVSANQDSGFSIVKYTGNGTAGATVGHGLSAKPQFILFKNLDTAVSWIAYDTINNVIGYLDNTDSLTDGRRAWAVNNTDPTNTLVTLGNNQATNAASNFIMYCWHSVAGFSSIGTYTGNGSTTGPSVTVGFMPSWVMIKRTSDTGSWYIFDAARAGSTTAFPKMLYPNLNNIEYDTTGTTYNGQHITTTATTFEVDFSSAWTDLNAFGSTYLYMAIA